MPFTNPNIQIIVTLALTERNLYHFTEAMRFYDDDMKNILQVSLNGFESSCIPNALTAVPVDKHLRCFVKAT